jgi:hypothetical protein
LQANAAACQHTEWTRLPCSILPPAASARKTFAIGVVLVYLRAGRALMNKRCPGARALGVATLRGWRFAITIARRLDCHGRRLCMASLAAALPTLPRSML